jgi:hypothetical protein
MAETQSSPAPESSVRVIPLPYALYESNGLLFELYDGGKLASKHEIRWIKVEPVNDGSAARTSPRLDRSS